MSNNFLCKHLIRGLATTLVYMNTSIKPLINAEEIVTDQTSYDQ